MKLDIFCSPLLFIEIAKLNGWHVVLKRPKYQILKSRKWQMSKYLIVETGSTVESPEVRKLSLNNGPSFHMMKDAEKRLTNNRK